MMKPPANRRPKPMTGMYPGSGVAVGGQQGRARQIHNGLGGTASGGRAPGASKPRAAGYQPADFQKLLAALMASTNPGVRR